MILPNTLYLLYTNLHQVFLDHKPNKADILAIDCRPKPEWSIGERNAKCWLEANNIGVRSSDFGFSWSSEIVDATPEDLIKIEMFFKYQVGEEADDADVEADYEQYEAEMDELQEHFDYLMSKDD